MLTSSKYSKYYAFPVIGYEILKQSKIVNVSKISANKSLLIKCDCYRNYLVVYDLPYQNYLVENFVTEEMKSRNYILRKEILNNSLMYNNLGIARDFYIESRNKIKTEENRRRGRKKSVMAKEFYDVAKKIKKINQFQKIMATNDLCDRYEIQVVDSKYSFALKEYVINTMIDIPLNQIYLKNETKHNIIGIYPIAPYLH